MDFSFLCGDYRQDLERISQLRLEKRSESCTLLLTARTIASVSTYQYARLQVNFFQNCSFGHRSRGIFLAYRAYYKLLLVVCLPEFCQAKLQPSQCVCRCLISTPSVPKYKSQRFHYKLHTDVYRHILECRFTHFALYVVHSGISKKAYIQKRRE